MDKLIEALTLLSRYEKPLYPTHCEHDVLYVLVSPTKFSPEEIVALEKLGFIANEEQDHFYSFLYGSA